MILSGILVFVIAKEGQAVLCYRGTITSADPRKNKHGATQHITHHIHPVN